MKLKIKQHLVVTNLDEFLKGNHARSIDIIGHKTALPEWFDIGEIEIEHDVDIGALTVHAVKYLDAAAKELYTQLSKLEQRKQELLAITYDGEQDG